MIDIEQTAQEHKRLMDYANNENTDFINSMEAISMAIDLWKEAYENGYVIYMNGTYLETDK